MSGPAQCPICGRSLNADLQGAACERCRLASALPTAAEVYLTFQRGFRSCSADDFEALCRRHPDLTSELRRLHAANARHPRADEVFPFPVNGRYLTERLVARGGMGVIYAVRDRELNRQLAMKVMAGASGETRPLEDLPAMLADRFIEEAKVTARLDHPSIVPVHDLGVDEHGRLYFTMKMVRGHTLGEVLTLTGERRDGWNLTRVIGVLVKACQAVAFAHEQGVIHRDLKPDNIMVGRLGEVYVMDWGLARVAGRGDRHDLRLNGSEGGGGTPEPDGHALSGSPLITQDGTILGTPAFMSPEHALGHVVAIDAQSDVYSLGAILYAALAGHPPYLAPGEPKAPKAVLARVRTGAPLPLTTVCPDAPVELLAICERSIARAKTDRYESAVEMAEELQAWMDGRVVRAYQTGPLAELRSWTRRHRFESMTLGIALLLLIAVLSATVLVQARANQRIREGQAALSRNNRLLDEARGRSESRARELREVGYLSAIQNVRFAWNHGDLRAAERYLGRCDPELRQWEWHYLDRQINPRTIVVPSVLPGGVGGFHLVPEGGHVISGGSDAILRTWDLATRAELKVLPAIGSTRFLESSPDGRWLVVGTLAGKVQCFDRRSGESVHVWSAGTAPLSGLAFEPEGGRLLWTDEARQVGLQEVTTGARIASATSEGILRTPAYDTVHKAWLVASQAGGVLWLDRDTLEVTRRWDAPGGGGLLAARLDPESRLFAAGGVDGYLTIVEAASGRILRRSAAHRVGAWREIDSVFGQVWQVAFSPDSRWVATGGEDLAIRIWSVEGETPPRELGRHYEGWISGLKFTADGEHLISTGGDGTLRTWRLDPPRSAHEFQAHGTREAPLPVWSVAFTPDSRRLLSAGWDGRVRLWDVASRSLVREFVGHTEPVVWSVSVSPRGDLAASGGEDGTVRLWPLSDTRTPRVLEARTQQSFSRWDRTLFVAFNPDGVRLVSGGVDGAIRMWDIENGVLLWEQPEHRHRVWCVAWSPEGGRVYAGGEGHRLTAMDATTGAVLWSRNDADYLVGLAASGSDVRGDLLGLSLDRRILRWDLANGQDMNVVAHVERRLRALAVSPNRQRILSAGEDLEPRLWDAASGDELLVLPAHDAEVTCAAFSPNGEHLVTGDRLGLVRLWLVTPFAKSAP